MISQQLMFEHLGQEVNVILHDGSSFWRRLVGVFEGQIMLDSMVPGGPLKPIRQEDIRSFGTETEGILQEVEQ